MDQGFNVTAYGETAFNECIPNKSFAQHWGTSYIVFVVVMQLLNLPLLFIVGQRLHALMYGMKKKAGEEYYTLWWTNSVAHNYIFISICVYMFVFNLIDIDGFVGFFNSFGIDMILEIRSASMIYVLIRSLFSWIASLSSGARAKLSDAQTAAKYFLCAMAWSVPFLWIGENFDVLPGARGVLNAYWGAAKLSFVALPAFMGTAGSESL